jgi:hypothetical protein
VIRRFSRALELVSGVTLESKACACRSPCCLPTKEILECRDNPGCLRLGRFPQSQPSPLLQLSYAAFSHHRLQHSRGRKDEVAKIQTRLEDDFSLARRFVRPVILRRKAHSSPTFSLWLPSFASSLHYLYLQVSTLHTLYKSSKVSSCITTPCRVRAPLAEPQAKRLATCSRPCSRQKR